MFLHNPYEAGQTICDLTALPLTATQRVLLQTRFTLLVRLAAHKAALRLADDVGDSLMGPMLRRDVELTREEIKKNAEAIEAEDRRIAKAAEAKAAEET